jgi:hypothetical protein
MARAKTISRRPRPPTRKPKPGLPEEYQAKRYQRMPTPWYRQTPRGQSPKRGGMPLVSPKGGKAPSRKRVAPKVPPRKAHVPVFEDMKGWNPAWEARQLPVRKPRKGTVANRRQPRRNNPR